MRTLVPILCVVILAAVQPSATAATPDHVRYAWPVIGIRDGDTLTVNLPGLPPALNPVAVRLRSVDTPESGGRANCATERKLAERATLFTRRAIEAARRVEFTQPSWTNMAAGSMPTSGSTANYCPIG